MDALTQVREEIAAKGAALHEIFTEAGSDLDLTKVTKITGNTHEKAAEIKRRNDELTELGKKADGMWAVVQARDALNEVRNPVAHPDTTAPAKKQSRYAGKTIGDVFVESDAFKRYKERVSSEIDLGDPRNGGIELKALLDTTGFAPESTRISLVLPGALRRPVVADLIPQGTTNAAAIKYMEETTTTNAAATVAEGAAKPESTLVFTEKTSNVRKIATVLPVTDELFEDAPAMRSYIEARLRLFLQLTEETQLISGSGVAPQLTGMLNVAGISTQAKGADPTPDAIYKAMTLIRTLAFLDPSGVIAHPNDWQDIRLLRTADGLYIWGAPMDSGPERIWGVPVVVTPAATENTIVVAAFDTAMQIFRRNELSFAVSDQHSTFFTENKLMLRVEERLAFVVYRPKGICTVTGV